VLLPLQVLWCRSQKRPFQRSPSSQAVCGTTWSFTHSCHSHVPLCAVSTAGVGAAPGRGCSSPCPPVRQCAAHSEGAPEHVHLCVLVASQEWCHTRKRPYQRSPSSQAVCGTTWSFIHSSCLHVLLCLCVLPPHMLWYLSQKRPFQRSPYSLCAAHIEGPFEHVQLCVLFPSQVLWCRTHKMPFQRSPSSQAACGTTWSFT
jgi:hypothetical protein